MSYIDNLINEKKDLENQNSNLNKENFELFNDTLLSDIVDEKKYNSALSPKQNIEKIKEILLNQINDIRNRKR